MPDVYRKTLTNCSATSRGLRAFRPFGQNKRSFASAMSLSTLRSSFSKWLVCHRRLVHHVAIANRLSMTAALTEYALVILAFSDAMKAEKSAGEICQSQPLTPGVMEQADPPV